MASKLRWLTQADFEKELDVGLGMEVLATFTVDGDQVRQLTGHEVNVQHKPFEAPGPYRRWFAATESIAFTVTNYDGTPLTELAVVQDHCSWRTLFELDLPNDFLSEVAWVRGFADAVYSVFAFDRDQLRYEFYRAESHEDAKALVEYLQGCGVDKTLEISASEDLNQDWAIFHDDREIGRYTSRYTAYQFAMRRSKVHSGPVLVSSSRDPIEKDVIIDGRIVK